MKKPSRAVLVTIKFVFVGIAWIILSDYLLNFLSSSLSVFNVAHIQLLKGVFFVGACGAFIFVLLHDNRGHSIADHSGQHMLFRANPMPMCFVASESFRFLELNDAGRKIFGYHENELTFLTLKDLVIQEDKHRFEEVYLFIKTGFDKLGVWNFRDKSGKIHTAEIFATPIRHRQAYLIGFRDVTEEHRINSELMLTKKHLHQQIAQRTDYLERSNEEMAYRASQTEHVNAELIVVNEQLLRINKRIAAEVEELSRFKHDLSQIFSALKETVWSYNLSDGGKCFLGSDLALMFETDEEELDRAWFWLNFIHPEDHLLKDAHQRTVFEKGETFCSFRIITKKGNERKLFMHVRIARNTSGTTFLVGSFADISGYPAEDITRFLSVRMA